jgi:hypothetical protein
LKKNIFCLLLFFFGISNLIFSDTIIGYFNPDAGFPPTEIINYANNYFINTDITIQPITTFSSIQKLMKNKNLTYLIISPEIIKNSNLKNNWIPFLHSEKQFNNSPYKKKL